MRQMEGGDGFGGAAVRFDCARFAMAMTGLYPASLPSSTAGAGRGLTPIVRIVDDGGGR